MAMPRSRASRVTSMSRATSGLASPHATERPLSAHQPSRISPQSSETRSPSSMTRGPGMPCTTSSLTDTQSEFG